MAVEVHGWNTKVLRRICFNTKAECQDEGKVFKETMASEPRNKEKLRGKTLKY